MDTNIKCWECRSKWSESMGWIPQTFWYISYTQCSRKNYLSFVLLNNCKQVNCVRLTLSKATTSIPPQRQMCFEWRQWIPFFSSRFCAYALLAVMAAGKMGGTTNVRMSRLFSRISSIVPFNRYDLIFNCQRTCFTPSLTAMTQN